MTTAGKLWAIWAMIAVSAGVCIANDSYAKPKTVPFPDRNPARVSEAAKSDDSAPKQPTGPIAKLPELLEYPLSQSDKKSVKEAIKAIYARRFSDARALMGRIRDKTALKLTRWYYYRRTGNDAKPDAIEKFRLANPDWPSRRRLQKNAEASLLINNLDADTIRVFFGEDQPTTGEGKAAMAAVYLAGGERKRAQQLIQSAWRKHDLNSKVEKIILSRFGKLLSERDHKARVDRLLLLDRKSRIAAVERTAKLLSEQERKKIEARIAVVRRLKKAKTLLAAIPDEHIKDDVGFYFSRIQWLRRHKREEEAWKLLLAAPREPNVLIGIDEWWIERRVNCRKALNAGKPEIAYRIARDHEPISGSHYREAEFLAGWIALRFLNKPDDALQHFLALRTASKRDRDVSKAEYWLGRTAQVQKKADEASAHFSNAAKHPLTYYGQLAVQALHAGPRPLVLPATPEPTQADLEKFRARDAVQAIGLVQTLELEKLAPLFFHQLARSVDKPGEAVLLAKLAELMDQPHASVRLSKIAFNRGLPMAKFAYPTNMLPEYKEINVPVEEALLYALSRQESEFNPSARSPVGARGLMQIMPRTARAIARQHKVRYRRSALTKDPSYNMMLGVAHLGDLLADYDGSYILTLVAYNAGGGRVRDWTKAFGDPRDKDMDAIDWVERIPFTETRNYVKKILSGVQIFRSRLNGPDNALQLVEDLNRGKAVQ